MFFDTDIRKILLDELRLTGEKWPEHVLNGKAVENAMYRAYERGRKDEATK